MLLTEQLKCFLGKFSTISKLSASGNAQSPPQIPLELFRHTFSHFHLDITPVIIRATTKSQKIMDSQAVIWYKLSNSLPGGVAAPVNKILKELEVSL